MLPFCGQHLFTSGRRVWAAHSSWGFKGPILQDKGSRCFTLTQGTCLQVGLPHLRMCALSWGCGNDACFERLRVWRNLLVHVCKHLLVFASVEGGTPIGILCHGIGCSIEKHTWCMFFMHSLQKWRGEPLKEWDNSYRGIPCASISHCHAQHRWQICKCKWGTSVGAFPSLLTDLHPKSGHSTWGCCTGLGAPGAVGTQIYGAAAPTSFVSFSEVAQLFMLQRWHSFNPESSSPSLIVFLYSTLHLLSGKRCSHLVCQELYLEVFGSLKCNALIASLHVHTELKTVTEDTVKLY